MNSRVAYRRALGGVTAALGALTLLATLTGTVGAAGAPGAPTAGPQSGCPSPACSSVLTAVAAATHVTSVPSNLTPPLQGAGGDILMPPTAEIACGGGTSTLSLPGCQPDGASPTAPRLALIGDSEAQTWSIALDSIARHTGYSFLPLAKVECTMADLTTQVPYSKGAYTSCPTFRKWAMAKVQAFNPSVVVISTLAEQFDTVKGKPISPTTYTAALVKTITSLQQPGRQIFVISNPPNQSVSPPICLAAHSGNFKGCETSLSASLKNDGVWQSALQSAATKTGASFVNVTPWFCDKGTCPLIIHNTEVYLDYGHMTSTYGVYLSGVMQAALHLTNACTAAASCNSYWPIDRSAPYTPPELSAEATG
jgi:hypothetical protein